MVAGLLGAEKAGIEGRAFAGILKELSPEHGNGKAFTLKQLAFHRAVKSGSPVEAFMTISVAGRKRAISVIFSPLKDHDGAQTGCIVTIRDATVLYALLRMSRIPAEAVKTDDLIDETLDLIANASRLKLVWLYLYDGNELTLKMQKGDVTGVPLPVCRDVPEPDSPTLQCRAFYRARPVLIKDYRRCASVRTFDPMARSRSIRSMAAIPLISDGQTLGILVAATGPNQPLHEPQLAELAAMCEQLSTGIARSMRGKSPADGGACP
jgi:transcriptional regulator with GAF, ATPase, and Fis domain